MKWVQVRGPHLEACDASGCEVQLTHMWHLMKNRDHHKEDILKLKHQYELRQQQVLKVKQIQTNKYGPDHPKMLELDAWATDKLKVELAKIAEVEKHLDNVESKISIYVEQVVAKFEKPDPDPDCDALLVEVESLFSNMSLSEQTNPETKESVAMDATSHALEKVQALPDGPEKSAMTAVLQAAVPSQVRVDEPMTSPASVPGASANSKMSDADLAAGMFARKDTTQLEAEARQTLHEKWANDPDAIFDPDGSEWSLVRVWDAMEFEDEHCEATSIGLEGRGELDEAQTRTEVLVNGFRKELESKSNDIKASRVELERLYALRVEDNKIDDAANVMFKEECMKALRGADANFTNLVVQSLQVLYDEGAELHTGEAKVKFVARCVTAWLCEETIGIARCFPGDEWLSLMASCLWCLAEWHRRTELLPRYLSEAESGEMVGVCDRFAFFYATLSRKAVAGEELLFPLRPKLHAMQEIAFIQSQECYNHRFYQGYKPEDFIGRMVTVVSARNNCDMELKGLKCFYLG
ncbi:Uncharacterized protein SCF082_LOCUS23680 [Durusdinium trenchii]|uniref:Uncharacterized protein n=1 Tax=Durusdinium trenchii TaxID=1381693 RepID=A0ABP0LNP1_9DINO